MKEEFRHFRLNRIEKLDILPEHFEAHGEPPELGNQKIDKRIPLTLLFTKEAAYRIYDEFRPYEVKKIDDGFVVNLSLIHI